MKRHHSLSSSEQVGHLLCCALLTPNYITGVDSMDKCPDCKAKLETGFDGNTASQENIDQDEGSRLSPEEDPGSGSVKVQVSDNSTIHFMYKRSLALKSEYFPSYLVMFHMSDMDMHMMNEKTVELNSEFVSSEAWANI